MKGETVAANPDEFVAFVLEPDNKQPFSVGSARLDWRKMPKKSDRDKWSAERMDAVTDEPPQRRGMSWLALLGWIGLGFVIAGLVAYRLVTPFFHRS